MFSQDKGAAARPAAKDDDEAIDTAMNAICDRLGRSQWEAIRGIARILRTFAEDIRTIDARKAKEAKAAKEARIEAQVQVISSVRFPVWKATADYRMGITASGGTILQRMYQDMGNLSNVKWEDVEPHDLAFKVEGGRGPVLSGDPKVDREIVNGFRRSRIREIVQKMGRDMAEKVVEEVFGPSPK